MKSVKILAVITLVLVVGIVAIQLFYKNGSKKGTSNASLDVNVEPNKTLE